jgi:hypothetical protein
LVPLKVTNLPLLNSWISAKTGLFHHQLINCLHTVDNRTSDEESIISVLKSESHNFFLGASDDETYSPRDQQGHQQGQQGGLPPRPPSARSRDKSPRSNTPSSEKSPRSNTPSSGHHSAGSKLSGSGSLQEGCLRNLFTELYYYYYLKCLIGLKDIFYIIFFMEQHSARTTVLLKQ